MISNVIKETCFDNAGFVTRPKLKLRMLGDKYRHYIRLYWSGADSICTIIILSFSCVFVMPHSGGNAVRRRGDW